MLRHVTPVRIHVSDSCHLDDGMLRFSETSVSIRAIRRNIPEDGIIYFLNKWKKYYSLLLKVHNGSDLRQVEMRTPEPLIPGASHFEIEVAIANLKSIYL
jgi:hypothetical protein